VPIPINRSGQNLVRWSKLTVYAYIPNFIWMYERFYPSGDKYCQNTTVHTSMPNFTLINIYCTFTVSPVWVKNC